jgi:hypothetical protein
MAEGKALVIQTELMHTVAWMVIRMDQILDGFEPKIVVAP